VSEDDNRRTHVDGIAPDHTGGEPNLPDGTDIEGYVVDGILGKGGMGVVLQRDAQGDRQARRDQGPAREVSQNRSPSSGSSRKRARST